MERLEPIVKNILLAFVLVTVGFALGKHSVRSASAAPDGTGTVPREADARVKLRVYYLHATFRCVTCNTIEKMTRELMDKQFGDALADGRIEWVEADFQENEALAKQFEVISSCVVVAKMRGETVLDYQRLDEVWTLLNDVAKFNTYVSDAIRAYLPDADAVEGGTP
ncbi:MAG: nitrophenyl compound nitroreductase subunit ArsF family protein [Lentisphaeria bacterium]|nr:nitrophenyl compound nitroreductase subunit ArsF family protein [Lentisphaeria bacterium]